MARFYTAIPIALTLLMLLVMGLQAYERINRAQYMPRPTQLPRTALPPALGWALFAAVMAFVLISTWQQPCAHNCGARFLTFLPLAGGLVILGVVGLLARRPTRTDPGMAAAPPRSVLLPVLRWAVLAGVIAFILITIWLRAR